jgi:membrane fusion protein, multidrug efflux system
LDGEGFMPLRIAFQIDKSALTGSVFLLALCLVGCNAAPVLSSTRSEASSPAVTLKPPDPATEPAAITATNPSAAVFTTTGPLVVDQQADVLAERDGRVVEVLVEIADHVHKGQVLARLDSREIEASRAAAAAKVDSLKAQVREWHSEQEVEEADLRRADIMRADSIMDQEDWEHVKYKLQETISEVARYKADESAAEFQLHALDVQMEQSRIAAPFTGVIGRRSVRLAQEVKKGDALFWLTAEQPLHILFTIPESALGSFHAGTRLNLTTGDFPALHQTAVVRRVSPVVDPASGSVEVIGDLDHPSPLLKPGMSMQVHLDHP